MLARQFGDHVGDLFQHLVAHVMAVHVVDLLEVVDVDHQEIRGRARRALQGAGALRKHAAIVEPGQTILVSHRRQLALGTIVMDAQDEKINIQRQTDDDADGDGQHGPMLVGLARMHGKLPQPQHGPHAQRHAQVIRDAAEDGRRRQGDHHPQRQHPESGVFRAQHQHAKAERDEQHTDGAAGDNRLQGLRIHGQQQSAQHARHTQRRLHMIERSARQGQAERDQPASQAKRQDGYRNEMQFLEKALLLLPFS
ncbi:hypothetical protein D3C72_1176460 [compost metagenome]